MQNQHFNKSATADSEFSVLSHIRCQNAGVHIMNSMPPIGKGRRPIKANTNSTIA